jgi:hypothetical protein
MRLEDALKASRAMQVIEDDKAIYGCHPKAHRMHNGERITAFSPYQDLVKFIMKEEYWTWIVDLKDNKKDFHDLIHADDWEPE